MGARLDVWKRRGGLAAGKARRRWRRAVSGGGVWTGENRGGRETADRWAWLLCWRLKSNQTYSKQFK
jgi:hypothetical protein